MVTFTDIVGIGYHLQGQLVHLKAVITTEDDHRTPDTLEIDMMTGEATAGQMLGLIQETEVQATQDTPVQTDTPAGTETLDEGTCQTTTEFKADHPHGQRSGSNRPPTPYARNNSRNRSSSRSNEMSPRHRVTIKDNHEDHEDQDYNNTDDYFDEDLN